MHRNIDDTTGLSPELSLQSSHRKLRTERATDEAGAGFTRHQQLCYDAVTANRHMSKDDHLPNDDGANSQRVQLLQQLVRGYAWCRIPAFSILSEGMEYLLVIELPDGRRYWRCLTLMDSTPDEIMLRWASYPPRKWRKLFDGKKRSKHWNEYFDFWAKPSP